MRLASCGIIVLVFFAACQQHGRSNGTERKSAESTAVVEKEKPLRIEHTSFTDEIHDLPLAISRYVLPGYTAIDTVSGKLNLDEYPDMLMVLRKDGEDTTSNEAEDKPEKRPLLILLGQADGSYKLEKRNDNVVLCKDCAGMFDDPFTGLAIKNGYFSIEHGVSGGHHWESVTTFKYDKQKSNWFLYKEGTISYKMNDKDDDSADVLVKDTELQQTVKDFGIVPFENYNTYKEDK